MVFKDKDRESKFWEEINSVIAKYPEVLSGIDECYEFETYDSDDRVNRGFDYNPESPKYISGMAFMLNVMNLDKDEVHLTLVPSEQSKIVTRGLMCNAH